MFEAVGLAQTGFDCMPVLDLIVCSRWFGSNLLFPQAPAWDALKLACQKVVFICLFVSDNSVSSHDGRQLSCCRSSAGRMLDTDIPSIPDAEHPAFYLIGIKASCVFHQAEGIAGTKRKHPCTTKGSVDILLGLIRVSAFMCQAEWGIVIR
jgi:hypothetical protein